MWQKIERGSEVLENLEMHREYQVFNWEERKWFIEIYFLLADVTGDFPTTSLLWDAVPNTPGEAQIIEEVNYKILVDIEVFAIAHYFNSTVEEAKVLYRYDSENIPSGFFEVFEQEFITSMISYWGRSGYAYRDATTGTLYNRPFVDVW